MSVLEKAVGVFFVAFKRNRLRRGQLEKENTMGSISIGEPLMNVKSFIFFR